MNALERKQREIKLLRHRNVLLAKESILAFTRHVMPNYKVNWHHRLLCETLDKFVAGEIKYLMVFMPPQHGKSQLVSRHLPAYILGRSPKTQIAGVSYAHSLAAKFNRDVQRLVDSPAYHQVFPDTTLNKSNVRSDAKGSWLRNSDEFEVVGHGGRYLSIGIGGGLTGNTVDVLIIDDPVKDQVEAKSPAYQLRNYEWWSTTALTRLHNDSRVIVCQTRWDELDLSGLLLKENQEGKGFPWHILSFPAIKEERHHDPRDPRAIGEALWPGKHSLQKLTVTKETNATTWNALYQQDPTPNPEAQVFTGWTPIDEMPQHPDFYGLDFGFSNDPTCLVRLMVHNGKLFIDEVLYHKELTNPDIADRMLMLGITDKRVYADSAEPKSIKELKNLGCRVSEALKGPDSILAGVQQIKQYEVFVTKRSLNIWNEYRYYQYHLKPDGKPSNEIRDAYNHAMDAIRYGLMTHLKKSVNNW